MAFDESLAARTRDALARERNITEKKMFGGLSFLLDGKLLVAVSKDALLVRLGPDGAKAALVKPDVKEVDMGGRRMKGWVVIKPDGLNSDRQLKAWVQYAIEFVATLL